MATQQVRVFVRDLGNGTKEAHVWPPIVFASAQGPDNIDFINDTADDIFLVFPDVFVGNTGHRKQIPKGLANKFTTPNVRGNAPTGKQAYSIFCVETSSLAIGSSPPEVIIE